MPLCPTYISHALPWARIQSPERVSGENPPQPLHGHALCYVILILDEEWIFDDRRVFLDRLADRERSWSYLEQYSLSLSALQFIAMTCLKLKSCFAYGVRKFYYGGNRDFTELSEGAPILLFAQGPILATAGREYYKLNYLFNRVLENNPLIA